MMGASPVDGGSLSDGGGGGADEDEDEEDEEEDEDNDGGESSSGESSSGDESSGDKIENSKKELGSVSEPRDVEHRVVTSSGADNDCCSRGRRGLQVSEHAILRGNLS